MSFQSQNLLFELPIPHHMLLFACKSSRSFPALLQHYRAALEEFQNKVCGGLLDGGPRRVDADASGLALLGTHEACVQPRRDVHVDATC